MKKIGFILAFIHSALFIFASVALAEEGGGVSSGYIGIGAGIAMGLAALGCGLGQGKAVSSALDSIGRNPGASGKMLVPMVLGLVFIETLVIFTFIVAFGLNGKIN